MNEDEVYAPDRAAWRQWLSENWDRPKGVWLIYDKGSPRQLSYDHIVEEAVCFGWIDSKARSRSESQGMLYVAPRKAKSGWSRSNKERVERLSAEGLMAPPGLKAIEVAKANGSWSALDDVENLVEPDELKAALDARPHARQSWDAFPRSAKRAVLEWISTAKTAPTREKRIQKAVDEAALGRRANQPS